jgi:hypothetical protein
MTFAGNAKKVDGEFVDLVEDRSRLQSDCCPETSIVARGPALLKIRLDIIAV